MWRHLWRAPEQKFRFFLFPTYRDRCFYFFIFQHIQLFLKTKNKTKKMPRGGFEPQTFEAASSDEDHATQKIGSTPEKTLPRQMKPMIHCEKNVSFWVRYFFLGGGAVIFLFYFLCSKYFNQKSLFSTTTVGRNDIWKNSINQKMSGVGKWRNIKLLRKASKDVQSCLLINDKKTESWWLSSLSRYIISSVSSYEL